MVNFSNLVNKTSKIVSVLLLTSLSTASAFALTYSQDIGVNFTFRSALQLSLSSADLIIRNLAPGTSADSNIITVNIKTNSTAGYTLNATVGNETTYDTRNLVHSTSQQAAPFTSVDFGSSIATNANLDPNKWAYSYSTNAGSTWANYSGLPKYDDETNIATLKTTTGPVESANGDNVEFKIAAKAADSQLAGTYNNVINFAVVAKPTPMTLAMAYADAGATQIDGFYKMQDMTPSICSSVEVEGDQLQVLDIRDHKIYWIAKLADGKCWMTQNLDLDLDSSKTYSHYDTDLGWGSIIDTTATWTPTESTKHYPSNSTTWDDSYWNYSDFAGSGLPPYSLDPGNLYWSGSVMSDETISEWEDYYSDECIVEGLWECRNEIPGAFFNAAVSSGDSHYSLGNYYDVSAILAVNTISDIVGYSPQAEQTFTVDNSICPAGWGLPSYTDADTNDFVELLGVYDIPFTTSDGNRLTVGSQDVNSLSAPMYFNLSGFVGAEDYAQGVSASGSFASNTVITPISEIERAEIAMLFIYPVTYSEGSTSGAFPGISVRCVAR